MATFRRGHLLAASAAGVLALALIGCSGPVNPVDSTTQGETTMQAAAKHSDQGLRTDLEPLTKRFSQLTSASEATWMSGTFGDGRVPGPTTYWIDAVVTLPPDVYAALTALAVDLAPTAEPPDVMPELLPFLPPGLSTSVDLDRMFSFDAFDSRAYVSDEANAVVLVTIFQ